MICVFDIETIPDYHLLQKSFGFDGSPLEIAQKAFKMQYEKSGSEFLPPCFHRVISISSVIGDEFGQFGRVGNCGKKFLDELSCKLTESNLEYDVLSKTFLDSLEQTLLSEFWTFFNKHNPKIVSFNGRGFDLPTLLLRAMRYGINAHAFYEQDNNNLNKSKWDNYRTRYNESFHIDLLDSLGHFGLVRTLKLDDICKMLDLVGKYDMSGEQVFEVYLNANDIESAVEALTTINHYCHSDVLNTYWVYLKYELLRGHILEADYYNLLQNFCDKLPTDKPYSNIFIDTLKQHIARYTQ